MEDYIQNTIAEWDSIIRNHKKIALWERKGMPDAIPTDLQEPSIVPYLLPGNEPKGAIVVCAGGAYRWKEPLEAFPHAKWINSMGFHAFILDYRVKPYGTDDALRDAQRAIRLIRSGSAEWKTKKDKVAVLGFSSGGHLSAMASTHFDTGNTDAGDPVERESCRPDAQILCYPHITYDPYIKDDPAFIKDFFGEGYTQRDLDRVNAHLYVRPDTPPAFIWGMHGDWQFGQKHWSLYAEALDEKSVPYSYHIFPNGSHGEGREEKSPVWRQWTTLCEMWLEGW